MDRRLSFYQPGDVPQMPGYPGSDLYDWMRELEDESYYGNWIGNQGYLGTNRESDLARSLYSRFRQGYNATLFDNPDYKWADYLEGRAGNLPQMIAGMDPDSRGYQPGSFVANGQARWLQRSR